MDQMEKRAAGEADLSFRERIEKRIGKTLAEKYADIAALLALLDYRFRKDVEEEKNDWAYGLIWVFFFDSLHGKKPLTRVFAAVLAPVLWAATRIKYAFRRKADTRLAFSNTFLWSRRYPRVMERVEEQYGCTGVLSFYDTVKRSTPSAKEMLRDTLHLNSGSVRPVYIPRYSIAGAGLQRTVSEYFQLLYGMAQGEKTAEEDTLDRVLSAMRKAYNRRVAYLTERLKKEGLKAYITTNQYNLRDLLLIHACKEAGIPSMELEHHAMEFARDVFDPDHPRPRLSFVSHYGFWSGTEKEFHEKVFRYDNFLYPPEANRYIVSGNAEMSYEQAAAYQKQYPVQRKLTYMTTGIEETTFPDREDMKEYIRWRWRVFTGLRELSERQNIQICLRYTPFREKEFREKEIPVLKEWGFLISESVPENLMEDMCSSMAVMSSTSSVLATARLMGKTIYRVADVSIPYVHIDDRVHEVTPETIRDIVIPEGAENRPEVIDRDSFFNIDRIVSSFGRTSE